MQQLSDLAATSFASSTTCCTKLWLVRLTRSSRAALCNRTVNCNAAKLGLQCHLAVYHGRLSPPTPEYETSGNAFLNRLFGAHLHDVPWTGDRNGAIWALGERLRQEGRRPYFVPYGVSNVLGAVGYASTIDEIAAQSSACGFHPSAIVHCTGSAATQAGRSRGWRIDRAQRHARGWDRHRR